MRAITLAILIVGSQITYAIRQQKPPSANEKAEAIMAIACAVCLILGW